MQLHPSFQIVNSTGNTLNQVNALGYQVTISDRKKNELNTLIFANRYLLIAPTSENNMDTEVFFDFKEPPPPPPIFITSSLN